MINIKGYHVSSNRVGQRQRQYFYFFLVLQKLEIGNRNIFWYFIYGSGLGGKFFYIFYIFFWVRGWEWEMGNVQAKGQVRAKSCVFLFFLGET
jgi:hypothetical protein